MLLSNSEIMKSDEMNFDILGTNNHQGPITGLDICIRKPLIVTVSTDKSVRLWNYLDRSCELTKFFPDEIYSVAIHPTGLQVSMGCKCSTAFKLCCISVYVSPFLPITRF